ncbi:LysR family transcriptional regulator [Paenibacillus sp. FSL H7-0716]|uniref:LysR family transcriptional regulator n=1 Tax=Paenibacillus odorifer TaxID=189426 RepID=A0A1R0YYS4_9BACL|nr:MULTISPECIES: LysR family transcriptional regulator [Paenibacillus]AWV34918.1 LysR family transcriptional regulator [Paenibacillus odorifer]MDH6429647.1 LysR family transcriptional activator of glutamate synthase operon [Paenibacillus sp. PastH-4]MDH6446255.1 LysR family transcriptional activator of glutamate synthase operon [Paenibacillus sp. PastF-4]MDH6530277.1 LysR family transcriptional activator of glutamate synthase operon [Paenibacillus sp. PastH-3]OMD60296.1 LysR family transcripti
MNLEQCENIVEVAKIGSLTKAAQNRHITLSAMSQSITMLEAELGVTLFIRSRGQKAVPTAEGNAIISKANEVLMKVNELKEEAQIYSDTLSGHLKIATIPGPMHLMVKVISSFKADFPNVKIEIFEKGPKEILDNVLQDEMDIGLMVSPEGMPDTYKGVKFERLMEGKIVVGVHPHSPLALNSILTPDQLVGQTLVLYDDPYIKDYVERYLSGYGPINLLFVSNNTRAIENAVAEGLAITIGLDYSFLKISEMTSAFMKTIELRSPDTRAKYSGAIVSASKQTSQTARRFINRLKHEFDEMIRRS